MGLDLSLLIIDKPEAYKPTGITNYQEIHLRRERDVIDELHVYAFEHGTQPPTIYDEHNYMHTIELGMLQELPAGEVEREMTKAAPAIPWNIAVLHLVRALPPSTPIILWFY